MCEYSNRTQLLSAKVSVGFLSLLLAYNIICLLLNQWCCVVFEKIR